MDHDVRLIGYGIRLDPLRIDHAEALSALTDDGMWAGMTSARPRDAGEYSAHIAAQVREADALAFAVVDDTDGKVLGTTSLYDLSVGQKRVEIGSTWYGRDYWGGRTNPAAKWLLLSHSFDTLDLYRVGLRCDARNARSAAAIQRLGGVPEAVLRSHRVAADGSRSDTAYFSILRPEWPDVRAGLRARLTS